MAIFGIEGGIGSGKTISLVTLGIIDLKAGKKIYSNIRFKKLPVKYKNNVEYLTKNKLTNIFELIKIKKMNMVNSTVLIQEAHNYMDSRNSSSKPNKIMSYWILQSRHTGKGSCDIVYDTQELTQVDKRLRRNTDFVIRPYIVEKINDVPSKVLLLGYGKIKHKYQQFKRTIDVSDAIKHYDTHEIVEF